MIRIVSDWSDVDREIDRLEGMPGPKAKQVLKAVLEVGFGLTQEAVHVESGALKASGKAEADSSKVDHVWEGTITYGDKGGPVDYAIYEKRRGVHWVGKSAAQGDHDFMRPLKALHPAWVAAIEAVIGK